jgi:hypothetical protein
MSLCTMLVQTSASGAGEDVKRKEIAEDKQRDTLLCC